MVTRHDARYAVAEHLFSGQSQVRFLRFMVQTMCLRSKSLVQGLKLFNGKYAPNQNPQQCAWMGNSKSKRKNSNIAISKLYKSHQVQIWWSSMDHQLQVIALEQIQHVWRPWSSRYRRHYWRIKSSSIAPADPNVRRTFVSQRTFRFFVEVRMSS